MESSDEQQHYHATIKVCRRNLRCHSKHSAINTSYSSVVNVLPHNLLTQEIYRSKQVANKRNRHTKLLVRYNAPA